MLSCYPTLVLDDLLSISVSCICSDNMITPDMIGKERNRVFVQYIIHNIYSILLISTNMSFIWTRVLCVPVVVTAVRGAGHQIPGLMKI